MECPVNAFPHVTNLELNKKVEFPEPVQGKVSGKVPIWLNGSWYRNGPGVIHFRDESVQHWFDGMALVRRFKIENGEATYTSRIVAGDSFRKNTEAGRIVVPEFGTQVQPSDQGLLNKIKNFLSIPEFTDNCLINIIVLGDHVFAITESNFIRKIDSQTLETLEKVDLSQYLPINIMASHPLVDNSDGSLYIFSSSIFSKGRTKYNLLNIPKINPGENYEEALSMSKHVGSLDSSWRVSPSYHHSFSMTENYAVFVEMPLKIDIPKMSVAHLRHVSYSKCIDFLPETQTHFFLINKKSGKRHPITFKTDPLIVYHHINAYEEDNHVVVDMCAYWNNEFYQKYMMENLLLSPEEFIEKYSADDSAVRIVRVVLPLSEEIPSENESSNMVTLPDTTCTAQMSKEGKIIYCKFEEILVGAECPSINKTFCGKKYNYVYSSGGHRLPPGDKLMKIDLKKKKCLSTWQEKGCWLSQPVFVSKPESNQEDEGVVLSSVTCEDQDSFLLLLDAQSFKEIARIHFEANIPPCLHGVFVPQS